MCSGLSRRLRWVYLVVCGVCVTKCVYAYACVCGNVCKWESDIYDLCFYSTRCTVYGVWLLGSQGMGSVV